MPFEDFDDVRGLRPDQLEELLRTGDALERLWAAWSLALGHGDASRVLDIDAQPDPGVRAHLVVLLASFGKAEALFTVAERDPDAGVRAAACQYLIQTARTSDSDSVGDFLRRRFEVESDPEPIARILRCLPSDWSLIEADALATLLAHPAPSIRLAVIQRLGRTYACEDLPQATLLERFGTETEPRVLLALTDLVDVDRATHVLAAASRVPAAALRLLEAVLDRGWRVRWEQLAVVASMDDPRLKLRCLELCAVWRGDDALGWLATAALGGWYTLPEHLVRPADVDLDRDRAYRETTDRARDTILELLREPGFTEWAPLRPALRNMLEELDEELTWLLREEFDSLEAEGIDDRAEVVRLLRQRRRLSTALAPIVRTD